MNNMHSEEDVKIVIADASHEVYVDDVLNTIRDAARKRGTGIAERTHDYVATLTRAVLGMLIRATR